MVTTDFPLRGVTGNPIHVETVGGITRNMEQGDRGLTARVHTGNAWNVGNRIHAPGHAASEAAHAAGRHARVAGREGRLVVTLGHVFAVGVLIVGLLEIVSHRH